MSKHQTAKSASIIGVFVMMSRVLGLLRETLFAYFFGAGALASVFINAFRIPNLLRDLFAEGALSTAFVTTFSKVSHQKGDAEAYRLANLVLNTLAIILGGIVILGIVFSPQIVELIASEFSPENKELMRVLLQIMFPFILVVSFAAVWMGILNAKNKFAVPASASSFFNIGSIIGGFGLAWLMDPSWGPKAAMGMALGVMIGGFLQWLIQAPTLWKLGYRYRFLLSWRDPGLRKIAILMGPAVIATAAVQVNVLVNTIFANFVSEEAASRLYYAFRFLQLPIGVFGVAIGTAMLPSLSRAAADKNEGDFKDLLNHSLQLVFFLCIPATAGLIYLGDGIIGTIYQLGGKFGSADTANVARVLQAYSLGLVGYASLKILTPAFYALGSSVKPSLVSLGAIGVNLALNYIITLKLGYGETGLAFVTACVVIINSILLTILLSHQITGWDKRPLLNSALKIIAATLMMTLLGGSVHWAWKEYLGVSTWLLRFGDLAVTGMTSLIVYVIACKLFNVHELGEFTQLILRRRKRPTNNR